MSFEAVLTEARSEGRTLLSEVEAKAALAAAGVTVTDTRLATSANNAVDIANALGYPAVLKIVSADIAHKSDAGGVLLWLEDAGAVHEGYKAVVDAAETAAPNAKIDGVSVQPMFTEPGVEVIVGMTRDPQFGPVMMFGLGGIFVEVMEDVAFRLTPLTDDDAFDMMDDIAGRPMLEGVRGQEAPDIDSLADLMLAVSAFVEAHPEIQELDLNPVIASPSGAVAVDARIVISEAN